MRYRVRHIASLFLLVLFGACRTEVVLDLRDAPRRLVIDGLLKEDSTQSVHLSLSGSYYEPAIFPVQDAELTLTSNLNGSQRLQYDAGGRYFLDGIVPQTGTEYVLTVTHEGITYVAATTFPAKVAVAGADFFLNVANTQLSGFSIKVADPPGRPNYYRVRAAVRAEYNTSLYHLFSDEGGKDGDTLAPIFFLGSNLSEGDTVHLELQSLDQATYAYYTELSRAIISSNTSATPFNPVGNFGGDAFGYFGSAVRDTATFVID